MRSKHNRLFAFLPTIAGLLLGTGCVVSRVAMAPDYVQPEANQPHAIVKVRTVYHSSPETSLEEGVLINGRRVHVGSVGQAGARIVAIRAKPEVTRWELSSRFFHVERRSVTEHYSEQEPYTTTEYYHCSTGSGSSSSCTRSVTKYRTVSKTRTVMRNEEVADGSCGVELQQQPSAGSTYLLQYEYYESGRCTASCFEQVSSTQNEGFDMVPCV